MSAVINTNLASLFAQNALSGAQGNLATSVQRLSSGLRINSSKDDASGLAIAQSMQGQINAVTYATQNESQAVNMAQTADTSMGTVQDILLRMKQLSVEGSNSSISSAQQGDVMTELNTLATQIANISSGTTYNGIALLGTDTGSYKFQVGASTLAQDTFTFQSVDLSTDQNGLMNQVSGFVSPTASTTFDSFQSLSSAIDTAVEQISSKRAAIGAQMNALAFVGQNLQSQSANLEASRSTVIDTDFSAETANLTKGQIMQQAATAMLAQANQMPNVILSLLK